MFCKSPTVATLLGLEFAKFTKPALSAFSGFATGFCSFTLGFGSPFIKSPALYQLPSLPFSRISPASFFVTNGLAAGLASFFGCPLDPT